ncbi:MAG: TIGR01777 family protein [Kiritimatiellales bacterium]|nr:TIGR01777 family protein [Kiritimatiellales bacterium]
MKVIISGSHGLVGSALKAHLEADGCSVEALSRDFTKPINFEGVDAVVHLAGESIATGRWNTSKKKRIEESRVVGTRQLAEQLAKSPAKPKVFISASAIGYYGDRDDEILSEESAAGTGFLSSVCEKWEESTLPAESAGIRTVKIRTGIVLSKKGGALAKMLPPFKMGGGGKLGNGRQYMSWISLYDMVGIIRFLIENENIHGPVNLVAPNAVTNLEFTKVLGTVLHRPVIMPLPAFAARLIFGEMADALLLSSTRVIPQKLLDNGYQFKHADLQPALEDSLK